MVIVHTLLHGNSVYDMDKVCKVFSYFVLYCNIFKIFVKHEAENMLIICVDFK